VLLSGDVEDDDFDDETDEDRQKREEGFC